MDNTFPPPYNFEEAKAIIARLEEDRNKRAWMEQLSRRTRVAGVIEAHSPYIDSRGHTACKDNRCVFLGTSVAEHYLHVAAMVIADVESDAEPQWCPYDCDGCHDEDCPCERMGCAGEK